MYKGEERRSPNLKLAERVAVTETELRGIDKYIEKLTESIEKISNDVGGIKEFVYKQPGEIAVLVDEKIDEAWKHLKFIGIVISGSFGLVVLIGKLIANGWGQG